VLDYEVQNKQSNIAELKEQTIQDPINDQDHDTMDGPTDIDQLPIFKYMVNWLCLSHFIDIFCSKKHISLI